MKYCMLLNTLFGILFKQYFIFAAFIIILCNSFDLLANNEFNRLEKIEKIKKYLIESNNKPEEGKFNYIKYSITNFMADTLEKPTTTIFEKISGRMFDHLKCNDAVFYRLGEEAVYIFKNMKAIYFSKTSTNNILSNPMLRENLLDSILDYSDIIEDSSFIDNSSKEKYFKVSYKIKYNYYGPMKISDISFTYNISKEEIRKIDVVFSHNAKYRSQCYEFHEIVQSYNYNNCRSLDTYIYNEEGKLLPKYADFQIIDLRK